jgi:hypothetical protein
MFCKRRITPFEHALATLTLPDTYKAIIVDRYILMLNENHRRIVFLTLFFHTARLIITAGSILVPALLSILTQHPEIYWVTWVCSLLVTICHGLVSIFKIDKKFYLLHTVNEKLISEGWQYLELSCKYSGYNTPTELPTHENQFVFFCAAIERLRMKHVQEEYFKLKDKQQKDSMKRDEFMPDSPFKHTLGTKEMSRKLISYLSSPDIGLQNENKHNKTTTGGTEEDKKNSEDRSTKSVSMYNLV